MSAQTLTNPTRPILSARLGLTSRTTVTMAMAGGVLAGGILVAMGTLTGRLSGHALLLTSTALFLMGSLGGFFFGALLGLAGREPGTSLGDGARGILRAALYSVLGLAVSWVVAIWVAMSYVAAYLGRPGVTVLVAVAWVASAFILVVGVRNAAEGLVNAIQRIREHDFRLPSPHPVSHR